ncbi:helix-turn-helix domain-containing protein [Mycobacterium sp. Dal123C01]|uniref:helix-turn-helix domain-containing protein n=1 Tax=Mycobacterium sp. Dal123C01 TaxID=3457577 RepID=UPI00403EEDFC
MPTTTPLLFTLDQTAGLLGCTPKWLADQLRAGRFPGRKVARKWMLSKDDLDEIVRRCAVGSKSAAPADVAALAIPHVGSMTRTTARRMGRDDRS